MKSVKEFIEALVEGMLFRTPSRFDKVIGAVIWVCLIVTVYMIIKIFFLEV